MRSLGQQKKRQSIKTKRGFHWCWWKQADDDDDDEDKEDKQDKWDKYDK